MLLISHLPIPILPVDHSDDSDRTVEAEQEPRQLRVDDADQQLAARVHLSLAATGRQQLRSVDVRARSGHVTLTGCVSSYYMKQLAQQAAMSVESVARIESLLVVEDGRTLMVEG